MALEDFYSEIETRRQEVVSLPAGDLQRLSLARDIFNFYSQNALSERKLMSCFHIAEGFNFASGHSPLQESLAALFKKVFDDTAQLPIDQRLSLVSMCFLSKSKLADSSVVRYLSEFVSGINPQELDADSRVYLDLVIRGIS